MPQRSLPHSQDPRPERRKLFGRRRGKALSRAQERLIERRLPALRFPWIRDDGYPVCPDRADFAAGRRAVWLEIGFGGGEHLAHVAAHHPDVRMIGCEPFINGVAKLVSSIERDALENILVHPGDARDLIEALPPACLERVFLLYPDPWPKRRHQSRRFMNPQNLAMLGRVMVSGAELRLATDIPGYVDHALAAAAVAPDFDLMPGQAPDWSDPWPDWPGTRYEAKAIRAGRRGHYLRFFRR